MINLTSTSFSGNLLKWDDSLQGWYLQLPSHPEIRIVPLREGFEDGLVELFKHPSITKRLFRLPVPYTRQFAETTIKDGLVEEQPYLQAITSILRPSSAHNPSYSPSPENPRIQGMPFHIIYDTNAQKIIGDIGLYPHSYFFAEKGYTPEEFKALPPREQMWDFGYVLDPNYGGRGLMTEVLKVIIDSWVVPWMGGVGRLGAFCDTDNIGSATVLKKNGFQLVSEHKTPWPEEKGGGVRDTSRYERSML